MDFTAPQCAQLFHGQLCRGVGSGTDGESNEDFVGVQTGIPVAQMVYLSNMLDGFDNHRGNQVDFVADACQCFQSIQQQCGAGAQQIGSAAGYDPSVRQFHSCGRGTGFFGFFQCRLHNRPVGSRKHRSFFISRSSL